MNPQDDKPQGQDQLDSLEGLGNQSLEELFSDPADGDQASSGNAAPKRDMAMFGKIPVKLTLEVDSVEIMLGNLLDLNPGEVLPLDKKVGEPLDVRVNGELLARAEVVVVDGRYGLRLVDVPRNPNLTPDQD
ncbi:FliM/FliN family flagellar motor switch protein [Marinobacter sp. CA1]|uniref:FliM/FliN family flagellar motor switch protein n=1 Tax=Marinobacter sp. CA1 TaxID=2817656 RepID=UPI002B4ADFC7|nr:FliM/FliN family flagellar motor switch protein [Marinobacter sp. CA1]UDL05549.1 FliM/FliN family flagellar motor switch protein [Marinobacter sp. CA1]